MKVEEQNQSARERQERGDQEDNIDKELEMMATHGLYRRSLRREPSRLTDEPRFLADEPGGPSCFTTTRTSSASRRPEGAVNR